MLAGDPGPPGWVSAQIAGVDDRDWPWMENNRKTVADKTDLAPRSSPCCLDVLLFPSCFFCVSRFAFVCKFLIFTFCNCDRESRAIDFLFSATT